MGVRLTNVGKDFGKARILQGVSVDFPNNALTVVVGPSGCGKSTVLRLIAGLEVPSEGEIFIDGNPVSRVAPFARGVGMVFQSYALYPHMTVRENMLFGLTSLRLPKPEMEARLHRATEMLDLGPYLDRKPKQLSGGQRQRVAMGRAIVRQPRVFLFDEPLSNLDAALRGKMRLEIARLRETLNATMIYVTHDQVEAMTLAHRIVVLRAGKVEQIGTPLEVYHRPANRFVASFLGSPAMNFVPVLPSAGSGLTLPDGGQLPLQAHETASTLGVRPEHLSLGAECPLRFRGTVFAVEQLGDQVLVHLRLGTTESGGRAATITARLPGDAEIRSNAELVVGFHPRHCHLFDGQGASVPCGEAT